MAAGEFMVIVELLGVGTWGNNRSNTVECLQTPGRTVQAAHLSGFSRFEIVVFHRFGEFPKRRQKPNLLVG